MAKIRAFLSMGKVRALSWVVKFMTYTGKGISFKHLAGFTINIYFSYTSFTEFWLGLWYA